MKTAFIYARFSSDNQREESIDAQLRACREYCSRQGIEILQEYRDEAKSATTDKRPGFQAMFQDLRRGVDFIIVHKLDRFSRDRYDAAYYRRLIKKAGAKLVSVTEPLDESPESIILESMLTGMAEYYSRNLAREVMKGLTETAYQCRHTGGAPLYGYKVNEDKTYRIDPIEAQVVQQVFRMYVEGYRYEDIVEAVADRKVLAKSAINSMLSNERYNGVYVFGRQTRAEKNSHKLKPEAEIVRVPGGMPKIIDDDTWARAQARLHDRRRNAAGRAKYPFLLAGKVICECGAVMNCGSSSGKGHEYGYYRCPNKCGMLTIRADKLDAQIVEAIAASIHLDDDTVKAITAQVKQPEDDQNQIVKAELKKTRKEIQGLVEAMKAGAHHQVIIDQLNELSKKEKELEAYKPPQSVSRDSILAFLTKMQKLQDAPQEEQRRILHALINSLKINKTGGVTVRFCLSMVAGERNLLYARQYQLRDPYMVMLCTSIAAH